MLINSLKESCFWPHRDISSEKVFFCQQLVRYGTICGSGGEFVNCGVRKDGTMGTMEGSAHASWEGTHMCGTHTVGPLWHQRKMYVYVTGRSARLQPLIVCTSSGPLVPSLKGSGE